MAFFERRGETARLRELHDSGRRGRPQIVLLDGAAASGKTLLLEAFAEQAAGQGTVVLAAAGSPDRPAVPFDLLSRLVLSPALPAAARRHAAALLAEPEPAGPTELARALGDLMTEAAADAPVLLCVDDLRHVDPASLEVLLALLRTPPAARLTAVLVERSQPSGEPPAFPAELLDRPDCHRLTVPPLSYAEVRAVLSGKASESAAAAYHAISGGNPLLLGGLLADSATGTGSSGGTGSPFLAGRPGGTGSAGTGVGALRQIPDAEAFADEPVAGESFRQAVFACLFRWDRVTVGVARALAVLGRGCESLAAPHTLPAPLLTRMTGLDAAQVRHGLFALSSSGALAGGWFRHPVIHTVVLDSLVVEQRTRLHLAAARLLHEAGRPAAEVARHLVGAGRVEEEWTVEALQQAADRALAADRPDVARECLEAALRNCADPARRAGLTMALTRLRWRDQPSAAAWHLAPLQQDLFAGLLEPRYAPELVRCLLWHGRNTEAQTTYRWLLATDADASAAAADLRLHAPWLTPAGSPPGPIPGGAQESVRSGAGDRTDGTAGTDVLTDPAPGTAASETVTDTGTADTVTGTDTAGTDRAAGDAESARRPASPDGRFRTGLLRSLATTADAGPEGAGGRMDEQTRAVLQTAAALATVLREGPGEEVVARAERVLAEHVPADGTVTALTSALHVLMFADRPDRAELWCRGLAEQAADRQAAAWQARFTAVRAAAVLRSGRPLEAERLAARSLELLTPHDWGVHVGLPLSVLVSARTLLGRHEQAAAVLEQFVPESMYRTPWGLAHLHARGHHLLAVGSAQAALADFRTCGELVTAWAIDSPVLVPWRSASAQARLLMGEPEKARALVEEQLALPSAAAPRVRGVSLRVLAATLPAEERPPLLRESVALLRRTGDLGEVVLALADLVAAHRALGDTAAAAPRERQLLRLAQATGLTERFLPPAADPAAPAARPAELTGLLSEAERRVAELAARGHTNRQISRRLFVTVSTVEQHLTRVYRKLHVTRRAELPSFF